jgi:hypothetical protein
MRTFVTRLMLPLLLLAQVFAGMSPGSVLCIAAGADDRHSRCAAEHSQSHSHAHAHADGTTHCHAHDARHHEVQSTKVFQLIASATHELGADADPCGCHFHVALPDDTSSPRARAELRLGEWRLWTQIPWAITTVEVGLANAKHTLAVQAAPWHDLWHATDQVRSRAMTRLLI